MTTTRAVFLDFAGTLFSDRDLREVHLAQLRFVASKIDVERSDSDLRTAYRHGMAVAYAEIAGGPSYLHRDLFGRAFGAMARDLGGELSAPQIDEAVDRQYQATVETATLRPDCLTTLRELRGRGLALQIVSNMDREQIEPLVRRNGLDDVLDAWTSSEEADSCKPDPAIFGYACAKLDCRPPEVLFVGDSLRHDIAGPAAVGMRTALLLADGRSAESTDPADHVITALSDIPALIELGASL